MTESTHKCPSCKRALDKQEVASGIMLWCATGFRCKSYAANDGYVGATEDDAFNGLKANVENEAQGDEE
jgi:ribosomal protein L37AE/L43A